MVQYGIVIRADGTIPFDADVSPAHKTAMLGTLTQMGYKCVQDPKTGDWKIPNHHNPKL